MRRNHILLIFILSLLVITGCANSNSDLESLVENDINEAIELNDVENVSFENEIEEKEEKDEFVPFDSSRFTNAKSKDKKSNKEDSDDNDEHENNETEDNSYENTMDESEYDEKMSDIIFMLAGSIKDFTLLLDELIIDQYMIDDEMWNLEMEFTLLDIQEMIEEVRTLNPPTRYKLEHELAIKSVDQFEIAFESYANALEGLSYSDVEKMLIASEKGTKYMDELTELVKSR